jgi:hypothetical protein
MKGDTGRVRCLRLLSGQVQWWWSVGSQRGGKEGDVVAPLHWLTAEIWWSGPHNNTLALARQSRWIRSVLDCWVGLLLLNSRQTATSGRHARLAGRAGRHGAARLGIDLPTQDGRLQRADGTREEVDPKASTAPSRWRPKTEAPTQRNILYGPETA